MNNGWPVQKWITDLVMSVPNCVGTQAQKDPQQVFIEVVDGGSLSDFLAEELPNE